uniref:von Hippel-Lindau disease tumour suppressor beta domain-containing protein n=1 Tax=Clastoptera arizonana TaxID=38151 RepID=A0A1B6E6K1_9HEMI
MHHLVSHVKCTTKPLMSCESTEKVLLRFWNLSNKTVSVIWLNFKGLYITYKILKPLEFFDANSFVDHPWIFMDIHTGDRLVGNKQCVYYPEPWPEIKRKLPREHMNLTIGRILVSIIWPLYSLRDLCLRAVRDSTEKEETILNLQVPLTVKNDLIQLWETKRLMS